MKYFLSHPHIKAILFDCDGTLVDSEGAHLAAWEKVCLSYGKQILLEERLHFVGQSDEAIARFISSKHTDACPSAEMLAAEKNLHFQSLLDSGLGLPPIASTVSFLLQLAAKKEEIGIKLGVASAANKHEVFTNLKHLEVYHLLDVVLSHEDLIPKYTDGEGVNKPKPYIYLEAAHRLGVSPTECVVVEDSQTGVDAAVDAGCMTIAVPNALSQSHNFSKAHVQLQSFENMSIHAFFNLLN
ncbi:MAG: HAD family hydrolase [Chlamydiales bacterium]